MRADLFLVEKGLATSRTRAQELIAKGRVFVVNGDRKKAITKASAQVAQGESLEVRQDEHAAEFVSRGGVKLQGALAKVGLSAKGLKVLDIGISTGGFTDCLLQSGARSVVGVDVGHDQLAPKLKTDTRVSLIEGVNARDLSQCPVVARNGGENFDLLVIDVSFISLTLVLPEAIQYLKESASVLALVKPQFEVGPQGLGKNGIVKDPTLYRGVEEKIRNCVSACGLLVEDYFESSIEGTDGNREFFVFARQAQLLLGADDADVRGGASAGAVSRRL
jgi:23S rRNA (cytidine1920-2'-O)/16S rRNA (cytidine1409-2'-O)-methyltransferase